MYVAVHRLIMIGRHLSKVLVIVITFGYRIYIQYM